MAESSSATSDGVEHVSIQHHSDATEIAERLTQWLRRQLPKNADPRVGAFETNETNGMSSDTVLFDATWNEEDGRSVTHSFVARIAPDADAVPVFPRYDLAQQFHTMEQVAECTDVPLPKLWWNESDSQHLGKPFFLMGRVDGMVPPDLLPYTFGDNWLFDGSADQRAKVQTSMIDVLCGLHAIGDPIERFSDLELPASGDTHLGRHLADVGDWYCWSLATNPRSDLIESALERLAGSIPKDPGDTVLSWGDSRIGNVLFDDFEPVAVLDWEMAVLGPRELDLTWLIYSHRVFQDLAESLGVVGMPEFMCTDEVVSAYERSSGHSVANLDWHLLFAATRWAIVFLRTGTRQAAVSGDAMSEDGNELLHNRPSLEQLLAGTYPY